MGTRVLTLARSRPRDTGKHGHVVDYRHVIHALRRKPMALLSLIYRDQLFPRRAYDRAFEALLATGNDRHACITAVGLLSLAHERGCDDSMGALTNADGSPP